MKYYLLILFILSVIAIISVCILGFVPLKYRKLNLSALYVFLISVAILLGLIVGYIPWTL